MPYGISCELLAECVQPRLMVRVLLKLTSVLPSFAGAGGGEGA
jgi:hypothetical protein